MLSRRITFLSHDVSVCANGNRYLRRFQLVKLALFTFRLRSISRHSMFLTYSAIHDLRQNEALLADYPPSM